MAYAVHAYPYYNTRGYMYKVKLRRASKLAPELGDFPCDERLNELGWKTLNQMSQRTECLNY